MAAEPHWKGSALMYEPGDVIDIWVVEKSLGRGGMGSVYRCHNRAAKRILAAVKVLDGTLKRYPEAEARFVREADILGQIDHPNIVKVRNVRPDADPPYIEMEFASGESLDERLQHGALPYATARSMMQQCSDALAYMHRLGIFHRDIKPANIIVDEDRVKLVDFGLAVEQDSSRITQQGVAFGTVSYAPPEWIAPERLDPAKWDVYALGVVFWEMLTGQVAFPVSGQGNARQQAMQVIVAKQGHEPLDPGDAYHDDVRALLADMTRADPAERVTSAEAIAERVRRLEPAVRRSVGATIAPPLENPFLHTAPPSAISRVDTPYPPNRPVRARTPEALPTTPVTSAPPNTGRYLVALSAAGAALVAGAAFAALGLVAVAWVTAPKWLAAEPPPPARLAIEISPPLTPDRVDVSADGATVATEPDGLWRLEGLAEGPAEIAWAAGDGCTVAGCAAGGCPPWCVTGRTSLVIVPGTVHTLTVDVPARPVAVALAGLDADVPVEARLGTVAGTRTPDGVQFVVPPGKGPLRIAAGPGCAEGAPVGQAPGCTVVEAELIVAADGTAEPARIDVAVLAPTAPDPAPSAAPAPARPSSPRGGFVTNADIARFIAADAAHRAWLPGGSFVQGVDEEYLLGWSADGTPPPGEERAIPRGIPALARAYCRWRGGTITDVASAPMQQQMEYRLSDGKIVLWLPGNPAPEPGLAQASPVSAAFRCTN